MKPRSWVVVVVSTLALGIRAWRVQASVPEDALSSLSDYLADVLAMWCRGSLVVLVAGAAFSLLRVRSNESRLERLGWAWAIWSAFMACVPPRAGNFWANGAADDEVLVYLPAGILAIVIAWVISRRPVGWLQFWIGLTIVSAAGLGLFTVEGGYGVGEMFLASAITAAATGSLALGTALTSLLVRRAQSLGS